MASVLEKRNVRAMNADAMNVTVQHPSSALENGFIVGLGARDENAVFAALTPATGALSNLYMVYTSECPKLTDGRGNAYKVSVDPRDRVIAIGEETDAFQLEIGDIIAITADGLAGTQAANTFVVAADGSLKLTWAAAAGAGLSLELLDDDEKVRIENATFPPTSYVAADLFRVVQL